MWTAYASKGNMAEMQAISYQEALEQDDKKAVAAIEAPSGDIARIAEFPNLTSLSVSHNTSIRDFGFLKSLPKLEKLYLANMELSAIPQEVAALAELNTLFLGKNAINDFALLAKLPKLCDLSLEQMNLKKVPDDVAKLVDLKTLGLYDNDITSLTSLKKLKNLESLFVASNRIKKLPKELAKLPLRELHIVRNHALEDYEVLGKLTDLETLSISNSGEVQSTPESIYTLTKLRDLTILPMYRPETARVDGLDAIGSLDKLEKLTIVGAPIEELPAGIAKLKSLKSLTLRDNEALKSIAHLRDLPELEELDLTSCDLREIGEGFASLKALKSLKLSHNKHLETIEGLRDLPALESLELFSKLGALPTSLGTLTSLRVLNISAKSDGVSFLQPLENLEELYIANCSFDALPTSLTKLEKLTVHRSGGGSDDYLQAFPKLVELSVNQPSFTLPCLPGLKSLRVGRIETSLDINAIGECEALSSLSIHRSDGLKTLPKQLASARGIRILELEFLEKLTNLSSVASLGSLEELSLKYLEALKALPSELSSLASLRKLTLDSLEELTNIDVVGEFTELEHLDIDSLDELKSLPESISVLSKLRAVKLRSCDELKNISVLEEVTSLKELTVDYCDEIKRKSIAAVQNAIESRDDSAYEPNMTYQRFIESGTYTSLLGQENALHSYPFPLSFDTPETLLTVLEDFSWLDDIRDEDDNPDNEILTSEDSALKPLAVLDFGWDGCDTSRIDSYCEEVFLVDTASTKNPVFLWGHDGAPRKIHDTFDDFLANLRDFALEAEDNGETNGERTYLEFVEGSSAKFWQVVVRGNQHEVTYGKIGKDGAAKVKEFASPEAARKDADKLIASKKKKGYEEKS